MATVTIKYTGVVGEIDRVGLNIAAMYEPTNSYVDSNVYVNGLEGKYGKSIYATNVVGNAFMAGLTPDATNAAKFAEFYRAIKVAEAATTEEENTGVTFEVTGYEEVLYWTQVGDQLAVEGFEVTITDETP